MSNKVQQQRFNPKKSSTICFICDFEAVDMNVLETMMTALRLLCDTFFHKIDTNQK